MGSCNNKNFRINEIATGHIPIPRSVYDKVGKKICKIIYEKNNEIFKGTGFFMTFKDNAKYVFTNFHVIPRDIKNDIITIELENEKPINFKLKNRNIKYFENLDITIIEIKESDELLKYINFFRHDLNYKIDYHMYENVDIFVVQFQNDEIEIASGRIKRILDDFEFEHDAHTEQGVSGSPIILPNILTVLGIHKQGDKFEPINYGSFIGKIFIENNSIIDFPKTNYISTNNKVLEKKNVINSFKNKNNIYKSICTIEYFEGLQNEKGKGILVYFEIPYLKNPIRGIITTNYILDTNLFYNEKISLYCDEDKKKYLIPIEHFCFSDPFIDITFIELKDSEYDDLDFIKIEKRDYENMDINSIYIIKSFKEKQIYKGNIKEKYGFKFYHDISLKADYSGSALISSKNNQIIGIYTNKIFKNISKQLNVAINIKSSIEAIEILYNSYLYDKFAFIQKDYGVIQKNLKILTKKEIKELNKKGLKETSKSEIFISPESDGVTPLWFYRTNYAWYWTPTEPKNNNIEKSNWIIIYPGCSLKVIGSYWDGIEPAERNINLIHWLETTGFDYLV